MASKEPPKEPEDVNRLLREYQMLQEQLRAFALQTEQLQVQKSELITAREEVSGAKGRVYITVGGVIVETDKPTALKNIEERSETLEVRLQSATKQYNELKNKEKQLRDQLTQMSNQGQQ